MFTCLLQTHLIPRDTNQKYHGPGNVQLTELMSAKRHSLVADRSKVHEKLAGVSQEL